MDKTCKYSKDCGHDYCPSTDCEDYEEKGTKRKHDNDCQCMQCWSDRNCDVNGQTISDAENGF